jgi:hypothetical protein
MMNHLTFSLQNMMLLRIVVIAAAVVAFAILCALWHAAKALYAHALASLRMPGGRGAIRARAPHG